MPELMSPQTLAQKIIAKASGKSHVSPGEIVTCKLDLVLMHDSSGPRRVKSRLEELGAKVFDPNKVVLVSDHFVPATDPESAEILALTRRWAQENLITNFYDMQGICHVMLPQQGHLKPGMFIVGGDSHSPTGGAFGTFMVGIGATEMTGALATGEIWIKVPETIRININGQLQKGCSAKDIMLHLCAKLGMNNNYKVMEFAGDTVADMPMYERMVLCNMSAELGGKTGIVEADQTTIDWINNTGETAAIDALDWVSDSDARYEKVIHLDASQLIPQVAAPHSPENTHPVTSFENITIHQAYIGACTGAKLSDLKMAAAVLKGQKVAKGTRLLIAPASTKTTELAAKDGTLAILTEAGAIILPTGCGACAGMGAGAIANGENCISSTSRNFKGRMGSPESNVYLASPYTVAACAITGEITDPRQFLEGELNANIK
ncbi:3-isopropylmalate/(R)-2-methylmalate dehydratase large subunit [Colwellia chukchiensis]|uniref:3-isopropylmalate/(R)-2-methylmalate dehydratase large subunit n=1 Tax=Colwellia chukchiensis TaxID=641665 RepID=A0A1H7UAE5_9GAMM|nr:3-isopropylmalate dehydratase large subunit [Colwellia chukchiensis]SEL93769.1 3-isopropylmalate/(R)-2-methylmalate dehydratase large subunit [Colwellia chukchiensis]